MQFQTLQDYKNIEALNEEVYHEYGMEVSPIQFQHMLKLALVLEYRDVPFNVLSSILTKAQIDDFFSNITVVTDTPRPVMSYELLSDITSATNQIKILAMFISHKCDFYYTVISRYLMAIAMYGRSAVMDIVAARRLIAADIPEIAHEPVKVYANFIGINRYNINQVILDRAFAPFQCKIIMEWLSAPRTTIQEQVEFISKAAVMAKAAGNWKNEIELAAEHMGLIKQYKKTCARWEQILA